MERFEHVSPREHGEKQETGSPNQGANRENGIFNLQLVAKIYGPGGGGFFFAEKLT